MDGTHSPFTSTFAFQGVGGQPQPPPPPQLQTMHTQTGVGATGAPISPGLFVHGSGLHPGSSMPMSSSSMTGINPPAPSGADGGRGGRFGPVATNPQQQRSVAPYQAAALAFGSIPPAGPPRISAGGMNHSHGGMQMSAEDLRQVQQLQAMRRQEVMMQQQQQRQLQQQQQQQQAALAMGGRRLRQTDTPMMMNQQRQQQHQQPPPPPPRQQGPSPPRWGAPPAPSGSAPPQPSAPTTTSMNSSSQLSSASHSFQPPDAVNAGGILFPPPATNDIVMGGTSPGSGGGGGSQDEDMCMSSPEPTGPAPFSCHCPVTHGGGSGEAEQPLWMPLREEDSIRVLELFPGQPGDPVTCQLHATNLRNAASRYNALSYTWNDGNGDPGPGRGGMGGMGGGGGNDAVQIICNSRPVAIRSNLHAALSRLRRFGASQVLWVDALCINLDDIAEKSSQVRLMGHIYQSAFEVLIWLGPENINHFHAPTALAGICSTVNTWRQRQPQNAPLLPEAGFSVDPEYQPPSPLLQQRQQQSPSTPGGLKCPIDGIPATQLHPGDYPILANPHTFRLFLRPWFHRVWPIQEAALARTATVLLGRYSLPWSLIGVCASILRTNMEKLEFHTPSTPQYFPQTHNRRPSSTSSAPPPQIEDEGGKSHQDSMADPSQTQTGILNAYFVYRISRCSLRHFDPLEFTFHQLLKLTRGFLCTDPRDRVYGVLAIPTTSENRSMLGNNPLSPGVGPSSGADSFNANMMVAPAPFVLPDYSKTIEEVYRDVALKIIHTTRSLDILSSVRHDIGPSLVNARGNFPLARSALGGRGGLGGGSTPTTPTGVPPAVSSWVPDYWHSLLTLAPWTPTSEFDPAGGKVLEILPGRDHEHLTVRGIIADTISWVSPPGLPSGLGCHSNPPNPMAGQQRNMSSSPAPHHQQQQQNGISTTPSPKSASTSSPPPTTGPTSGATSTTSTATTSDLLNLSIPLPPQLSNLPLPLLSETALTLTSGKDHTGNPVASKSAHLSDFLTLLTCGTTATAGTPAAAGAALDAFFPAHVLNAIERHFAPVQSQQTGPAGGGRGGSMARTPAGERRERERLERERLAKLAEDEMGTEANANATATPPSSNPSGPPDAVNFTRAATCAGDQRRRFATSGGKLGLGPLGARVGDRVCVLYGASVPFVLRRVPLPGATGASKGMGGGGGAIKGKGGAGGYVLVGECYVERLMHGEAVREASGVPVGGLGSKGTAAGAAGLTEEWVTLV